MKADEAKAIMTRIAEDYERIAKLVEQRLREHKYVVWDEQSAAPVC